MRSIAARGSRAEVRATRLMVEDLERDASIGLEGEARNRAEVKHFESGRQRTPTCPNGKTRGGQLVVRLTSMLPQDAMGHGGKNPDHP
ncbi:hypothetical protein MGU_07892 [Metarhizium guizhouense ARSEF 977]|uniref:Uncharacterized protein n=1 Tax=Metarhizium guizhouense (strain ARSEF 977) TaxID=1276136 RepID=A0A0B4GDC2_METGA|nr:hypothetical protein MGU_07892 [Metarhizium guizhouense ARSEF 977]